MLGESVHESDDLAIVEGWYSSVGMWTVFVDGDSYTVARLALDINIWIN